MDDVPLKQCKACENFFPATAEFFIRKNRYKDGLSHHCKPCSRKQKRERYHSDPEYRERLLAKNKVAWHSNPLRRERGRASVKAFHQSPKGQAYRKTYRQRPEVQEHARAYRKAYAQRPEVRERIRAYRKAHRVKRTPQPKPDRRYDTCTCAACLLPVDMSRREHVAALLNAHPDMTLAAIGKRAGCSSQRVSQLKRRIQEKQDQAEVKPSSKPRRISWGELWQWSKELWQWAEQHDYPRLRLSYKQGWIQQGRDNWFNYFRDLSAKRMRYVADSIDIYTRRHYATEEQIRWKLPPSFV